MLNFAIVGIGWWGQKLIKSSQGKSKLFRFTEGVSKEPDSVHDFCTKNVIHLKYTGISFSSIFLLSIDMNK
jgi:hypothetical protein